MSLTWIKPSMPLETLVPGDLGPVNEPVGDSDIDEEPEARDIRDCPVEHLTSLRRRDASPSAAGEPPAPRPSPTGSAGPALIGLDHFQRQALANARAGYRGPHPPAPSALRLPTDANCESGTKPLFERSLIRDYCCRLRACGIDRTARPSDPSG